MELPLATTPMTMLWSLLKCMAIHYDRDHSPIYTAVVLGNVGGASHRFMCTCVLVTCIDDEFIVFCCVIATKYVHMLAQSWHAPCV